MEKHILLILFVVIIGMWAWSLKLALLEIAKHKTALKAMEIHIHNLHGRTVASTAQRSHGDEKPLTGKSEER